MMTKEIFREDAYAQSCESRVTGHEEDGIILDQTVFYPTGGGQPGDSGSIALVDGTRLIVTSTRKARSGDGIVHVLADPALAPDMDATVTATIDWERRHKHMRMHTCLHLLCSLIDGGVTGGSIGEEKSRLDFDLQDTTLDKEQITADLNRLIDEDHPLATSWITDREMSERADLVRTMSVKPPAGKGRIRLMEITGVDLQPCGGTHVKSTAEIGRVRVGKIENKGKHNRRVNVLFDELPDGASPILMERGLHQGGAG